MNPKEVPNTRNISPNYNQNLLPNISINMNESKMDIESKHNSPMNSTHNPNNLVQLTQLTDPNDEYIYSPRRTMYVTRSSKKSNNSPNKNIKSVSNENEISEDFSANEISIEINTDKKEISPNKITLPKSHFDYKSPKKRKLANVNWSFPILGWSDEERNKAIENRDKSKYPDYFSVESPEHVNVSGHKCNHTTYRREQDMPIINNATIQEHPNLKPKQHKKKNSDVISFRS